HPDRTESWARRQVFHVSHDRSAAPDEEDRPRLAGGHRLIASRLGGGGREMRQRDHDRVVVVDFGAQYAQLIARRVREAKVYSEIMPHTASASEILARRPRAIILSGGPSSVCEPGAPQLDAALVGAGTPVLGICYGFMAMAQVLGGTVARTGMREYGRTAVKVTDSGVLLAGLPSTVSAWMSHGDEVLAAPAGFRVTATSARATVAAFENVDRRLAGVPWPPEGVT